MSTLELIVESLAAEGASLHALEQAREAEAALSAQAERQAILDEKWRPYVEQVKAAVPETLHLYLHWPAHQEPHFSRDYESQVRTARGHEFLQSVPEETIASALAGSKAAYAIVLSVYVGNVMRTEVGRGTSVTTLTRERLRVMFKNDEEFQEAVRLLELAIWNRGDKQICQQNALIATQPTSPVMPDMPSASTVAANGHTQRMTTAEMTTKIKAQMASRYLHDLTEWRNGDTSRFSRMVDGRGKQICEADTWLRNLARICADLSVVAVCPDLPAMVAERLGEVGLTLPEW